MASVISILQNAMTLVRLVMYLCFISEITFDTINTYIGGL